MRSSTSSSDASQRAPERPWAKVWIGALCLLVLGAGGLEAFGRSFGLEPQAADSPRLWAQWRAVASSLGNPVVLVGSSRVQAGIEPDTLSKELGRPVVMLALNGSSALPFLDDLMNDPRFHGTIISSVDPGPFFARRTGWEERSQEYVAFYRNRATVETVETPLRTWWQTTSVLPLPEMAPSSLLRYLATGTGPAPRWVTLKPSRFEAMDYSRRPERAAVGGFDSKRFTVDSQTLTARFELLGAGAEALRKRGGEIIFVRMPASPEGVIEVDREFPPEEYAGRLIESTGARFVDSSVEPSLRDFSCPDGAHLDHRDAVAFTSELARLIGRE